MPLGLGQCREVALLGRKGAMVDQAAVTATNGRTPQCGGRYSPRTWTWPRSSAAERFAQAALAAAMGGALALGMMLVPAPVGIGTHTLLGLPPCGMLATTGHPCPTCGVTTSFVLAAHGRFYEALTNQPFGMVAFLLAVGGLILNVAALAARRSWFGLVTPGGAIAAVVVLTAIALISWAYKWSVT